MTLAKATARSKRGRFAPSETMRAAFLRDLEARLPTRGRLTWPDPSWQTRPVEFFRKILGTSPWEKQIEIANACVENLRVAVRSNNKAGKSTLIAMLVIWYVHAFPRARVFLMANTEKQVGGAVYYELRRLWARAGKCFDCYEREEKASIPDDGVRPCPHSRLLDVPIHTDPALTAKSGLRFADGREIVGFSGKDAEGVAGLSSPNLVLVFDEASGKNFDALYEGLVANLAGDGRVWIISNPTRTQGAFFDIFHAKGDIYRTLHISAFDSPNVRAGKTVVPGLATKDFIELARREFGERHPFYRSRVLGEFPTVEKGAVFPLELVELRSSEWEDTVAEGGTLDLGVDAAGDSGAGDESAFAARRGMKVLELRARSGLTADQHVVEAVGMIGRWKERGDVVRVMVDREGEIGAKVYGAFVSYLATFAEDKQPFALVGVRASEKAPKFAPFDRVRDELVGGFVDWMKEGGTIPPDSRLQADLLSFRWLEYTTSGRSKLEDKKKQREVLNGRSPDRGDACALSVFGRQVRPFVVEEHRAETPPERHEREELGPQGPYDALDWLRGR